MDLKETIIFARYRIMKKKIWIFIAFLAVLMILLLPPLFKVRTETTIRYLSLFDDTLQYFEGPTCCNESYAYYEPWDVSFSGFTTDRIGPFYLITLEYKAGNLCDFEYYLEESYIQNFLANAVIKHNEKNIDLAALIEGKTAIVGNTRYLGNDYEISIGYILDGRHEILYVFYVDDLLVIQVGWSDEGPKFIAYQ